MKYYFQWILFMVVSTYTLNSKAQNTCGTWNSLANALDLSEDYKSCRDALKNNDYALAYKLWKKVYDAAPAADGKRSGVFDDGIKIHTKLFTDEKDAQKKKELVATIMRLYDERYNCYPTKVNVHGQKAFEYYFTFTGYASDDEMWSLFKKAWDQDSLHAGYHLLNPTTAVLFKQIQDKKISLEEGRRYMDLIKTTLDNGLKNCTNPKECEPWKIINDFVPARLIDLETVPGFYECEYYLEKYVGLFDTDPTNCTVINLAFDKLKNNSCVETDEKYMKIKLAKERLCKKTVSAKK